MRYSATRRIAAFISVVGGAADGYMGGCTTEGAAHGLAVFGNTVDVTVTALRQRAAMTTTLTAVVFGTAWYKRLPFTVPEGVHRLDVTMTTSSANAALGLGLWDAAGPGYQSGGFRGIFGEERSSFFVSTSAASEGFVPGPMPPGTWTVLVPVFRALVPTRVTVTVRMSFVADGPDFEPGPLPGVVVEGPGWYRGDLHCHTTASSDAWATGSALTPAGWADACRAHGLDFVAMTDHNVISQNYFLARDAGADVLLIAGEEMTNWFHGHATVSGLDVGQWLDFRQSPAGLPLPTGSARISETLALAEEMGAYVAAAHPMAGPLGWQFLAEATVRPRTRTHGFEVWTGGPWRHDNELALATWDRMLRRGWRTVANGGSDLHRIDDDRGFGVGKPTTVAYAPRLAQPDVIRAVRAGRCFVTRAPDGVEVYLTATRPGQETYVGGSVYGDAGDPVTVRARVRRGGGMRLTLVAQGARVHTQQLDGDDVTIEVRLPVPPGGGYVRAEVRSGSRRGGSPRFRKPDIEAFTNPVWLVVGDPPPGYVSERAPVPQRVGPRRAGVLPSL